MARGATRSPGWGITWPIVKQVHDAIWRHYTSNEFNIYLTLWMSTLTLLMACLVLSVLGLSAGMALNKVIINNFRSLNSKIEIHDSQCNLRCRTINIFKIFCRMNTLGLTTCLKWQVVNTVSEMTLASWRLQPWATRLFVRQIIQTNNKANTKAPHHWVLWEPSITGGFSAQMGRWCGNRHWYYDSYSTHYGAINLSTLTRVMACCRTEPSHYLNQFWLIIGKVQWGDTSATIY